MRPTLRRLLREAARLAAVVLVVFTTRSVIADHYHVPSGSMEPTVATGDHVLVNKLAYGLRIPFSNRYLGRFDDPVRGDVVVLASPVDGETLLKRVVAVPGDEVAVNGGRLVLNGAPVSVLPTARDPLELLDGGAHALRLDQGGGPDLAPVVLPPDRYLVMGDNRGNSLDGRSFGLVRGDAILGRAVAVFYRGGLTWQDL